MSCTFPVAGHSPGLSRTFIDICPKALEAYSRAQSNCEDYSRVDFGLEPTFVIMATRQHLTIGKVILRTAPPPSLSPRSPVSLNRSLA